VYPLVPALLHVCNTRVGQFDGQEPILPLAQHVLPLLGSTKLFEPHTRALPQAVKDAAAGWTKIAPKAVAPSNLRSNARRSIGSSANVFETSSIR
jgi:hypothetical protein